MELINAETDPQKVKILAGELARLLSVRRFCSTLVLCARLGFGVSQVVSAEDVPETAYDESEAPPYVSTSVFSIAVSKGIVAGAVRAIVPLPRFGSSRRLCAQRSERGAGRAYPLCDSLAILEHSLRC
jgi:hypothetical protein